MSKRRMAAGMGIISVLLILAVIFLIPGQTEYSIGVVLPLTGSAASTGNSLLNGVILAQEEGAFVLFAEDGKSSPADSATAFSFLAAKTPQAVVSALSGVSVALAPLAKENKIPLLATAATSPNITQNEFVFRYYPSAQDEAKSITQLAKSRGANNFGVLYLDDEFGRAVWNELASNSVSGESFVSSASELSTQLLKLKNENLDALVIVGFPSHIIKGVTSARQLGLEVPVITTSGAALPEVRAALNDSALFAGISEVYKEDVAEDFKQAYAKRFGKPADHYAAAGYDSAKILERAVQSGDVRNSLEEDVFSGLTGVIDFVNHAASFPLMPAKLEGHKIVYLQ